MKDHRAVPDGSLWHTFHPVPGEPAVRTFWEERERGLSAASAVKSERIFRGTVKGLALAVWPCGQAADLRRFALETLERHLERRLASARALGRVG